MTYTVTLIATNVWGSDTASETLTELNAEILAASAISTTVSKGINDLMWLCQLEYDGHPAIDSQDISVIMKDHTDTDQLVFMGYIPASAYKTQEGGNKTTVTAYSYFWYLTKQYLPPVETDHTGLQNTMIYVDIDGVEVTPTIDIYKLQAGETTIKPGETVYINITKYVTRALGGISSTVLNGLTIHEVTDNDDWNDGTLVNKDFGFVRDDITIMDALQAIREYTGYFFVEVFYNSVTNLDYAVWVPSDATDAQLHLRSKVTFTWPDEYVTGPVYGDNRAGEMYNKIRVRGSPAYLSKTFTATAATDTFVLGQYARAGSCYATLQHGIGGDIHDDWTITEHLAGTAVDWVTATGLTILPADLVTIRYLPDKLYYEQTWETAGVTTETEKPREYPPIWDRDGSLGLTTQDKVDEYCNFIQALIETDSSIYHATLKLRTDLRLMQLVKFVGYDKIPEDDMRITHITYRKGPQGIFVDIQCTLDRVLNLKRMMKDYTMVSDVNLIERVVAKKLKETNNEKTVKAWIKWTGNGLAIAQTDNKIYITKPTI